MYTLLLFALLLYNAESYLIIDYPKAGIHRKYPTIPLCSNIDKEYEGKLCEYSSVSNCFQHIDNLYSFDLNTNASVVLYDNSLYEINHRFIKCSVPILQIPYVVLRYDYIKDSTLYLHPNNSKNTIMYLNHFIINCIVGIFILYIIFQIISRLCSRRSISSAAEEVLSRSSTPKIMLGSVIKYSEYLETESLLKDQTTCSICIEDFENNNELICLFNCEHIFHYDCIKEWLSKIDSTNIVKCPNCQDNILYFNEEDSGREVV
tara:strand:- start:337 stop:1122 length:786 start_codon:yes stop_codon:yes gene_type:complete